MKYGAFFNIFFPNFQILFAVLDLKHNRLKDKSGRALGKLISTSKTLKELDLEDNEIAMEGCGAIAHALKKDQEN